MPFDSYLKMYQQSQKDIKTLAQQGRWNEKRHKRRINARSIQLTRNTKNRIRK
jgi:hypothetical protein